ncbi:MAG: hypothetical protein ABSH52_12740 [Terriglobia bacterium]|jgi:acetyl esterase/lipase
MQASTVQHITSDYPPSFITEGNTASFEDDARKLEAKLKDNGVYVDSLYYPVEHARIEHDYPFDFSIPEWIECYNRSLAFLARVAASK